MAGLDEGDLERLVQLLAEHPHQRARLRLALLGDEWSGLEGAVQRLAEAQRRTEDRLAELTERVDALAQRVDALAMRVDALAQELADRIGDLVEAQQHTELNLAQLALDVRDLARRYDPLVGDLIERRYRHHGYGYFGRIARRLQLLSFQELSDLLEDAVEDGILALDDANEVRLADGVWRGRRRDDGSDTYLVVEASRGVGVEDVTRAYRRAQLLARTGIAALGVVAGESVTDEAARAAQDFGVWQVTDGQVEPPAA